MIKLTKKRAIELHRELWDWLYHHPSKEKDTWPRWKEIREQYTSRFGGWIRVAGNHCFLCEFSCCLLVWPGDGCSHDKGIYPRYLRAMSYKTRKKYAKIIRDLPEAV